jgi:BON domain/YMGG-like Gly-zipper
MRKMGTLFAAGLMAVVLAAGCSHTMGDKTLATDLKAGMFSDPQVKSLNLDIAVKNGEVTLAGEVPDDAARLQAFKLASDTPGVKHVVDHMTVQTAQAEPDAEAATPPVPPPAAEPSPRRSVPKVAHRRRARTDSASMAAASAANSSDSNSEADAAPADAPPPPETASPAATAPADQQQAAAEPPPPPPPPQPARAQIPAGTSVRIQMIDNVDSSVNHPGEVFRAELASPIVLGNNVVVPSGANMYVRLINARSAGHMTGRSELVLELARLEFQGHTYGLVSNQYSKVGSSRGKRTAETVGGGAALGALLGAIIGHGKGAAIGAATGAGAGTVAQEATQAQQVQIPSETKLDFTLEQPVSISYFPGKNQPSR